MGVMTYSFSAVHWWLSEIQARVVANSRKPSDRFHLGKLILDSLRDVPDQVLQVVWAGGRDVFPTDKRWLPKAIFYQYLNHARSRCGGSVMKTIELPENAPLIDGGTGESETFGSALKRSVQCANALLKMGLKKDDVVVIMAPNHIHLCIPMYAAFYLGIGVAAVDSTLAVKELHDTFEFNKPKIIFCQSEKAKEVEEAVRRLDFECEIITFNSGSEYKTILELLHEGDDVPIDKFEAADFDPSKTAAMLIATSGTTGLPKSAEVTHTNLVFGMSYMWSYFDTFPSPTPLSFVTSPIQWYSAIFQLISCPLMRQTRLQSSQPMTQKHTYYLINKYRPSFAMSSPNTWMTLLKPGERDQCDFTSFELIFIGGSAMPPGLPMEIEKAMPNTLALNVYGMSELSGLALLHDVTMPESVGRPIPYLKCKLVNPESLQEITEPNIPGELWLKGPSVFKGYYNNAEVTAETITKDGWLRTGDIMYRDKNWLFYFVDRLKSLLKYRNYQISPVEIESLISNHPGVFEVAVTSVPHLEHGDLPVACIVKHEDFNVTAQEIKDLVKNNLADSKQLRGGVIFLKQLPLTASSKVDRKKLSTLAKTMEKE